MTLFKHLSIYSLLSFSLLSLANANQTALSDEFKNSFIASFLPSFKQGCVVSTMAQGVPESKRDAVTQFCGCVAEESKPLLTDEVIADLTKNMQNTVYLQQTSAKLMEYALPKCM